MAHSIATTEFWSPRQLDDHTALSNHDGTLNGTGLTGFFISGVSDAADTGVTDTGEFFSITNANVGSGNSEPEWTGSNWYNQDSPPDSSPVTVIGRTEEDATTNTAAKSLELGVGAKAAIYLSEIEHITLDTTYTIPAGTWTARIFSASTVNASVYLHSVVVLKVGFFTGPGSKLVFGGPGTSVIYTHTETAPFTTFGSTGTLSASFTTTSDTTIDPRANSSGGAAEKLIVMMIVANSSRSAQTVNFRHNRNILTPIPRVRTISLDAASVSTAAQPVTINPRIVPVGAGSVSIAAQPITISPELSPRA